MHYELCLFLLGKSMFYTMLPIYSGYIGIKMIKVSCEFPLITSVAFRVTYLLE